MRCVATAAIRIATAAQAGIDFQWYALPVGFTIWLLTLEMNRIALQRVVFPYFDW
ncbi:MAG: hypothetical protein PUP93_17120 [Rhizonema sp. NSF051]|nr:hypothetical protein [Rhizonema sp. NSF051]